ncbi:MAG: MopE-related protein [Myxococcota bacterium]
MRSGLCLLLTILTGCGSSWSAADLDGDGFSLVGGDCDDADPAVNPDAAEVWYDLIDQNCDGLGDTDKDGDGALALEVGGDDCWDDPDVVPTGFEAVPGYDQPAAADVNPRAIETWYDGVDQDCDGLSDFDQDLDGHDTTALAGGTDCYDSVDDAYPADAACTGTGGTFAPEDVNPEAQDTIYDGTDQDCSGGGDFDQDQDGWVACEECDDTDPTRFPSDAPEVVWYDGFDDNCDGNDGDQDGDGYYDADYAFEIPADYLAGDCWDDPADAASWVALNGMTQPAPADVYPGAADAPYDGLDAACDGGSDFDADGDGFATDAWPDGGGVTGADCDDADGNVNPDAVDTWYDGTDSDCGGEDDYDQDGDGHGSDVYGYTDCDDLDSSVSPDAAEVCGDTVDEDCSGSDNDAGAVGCTSYYADADGDGYGAGTATCYCEPVGTFTATTATDCDDTSDTVNPGAAEDCDTTVSDDCDASTNEANADNCETWYLDDDQDGYGGDYSACLCDAWNEYDVQNSDDCDDLDATVKPGATETCDDEDDDCDGVADDGLTLWYVDADGDTYGAAGTGDCANSGTGVDNGDDCDDDYDLAYPGALEICDGVQNDCDDTSWTDDDGIASYFDGATWDDVTTDVAGASLATYKTYYLPDAGGELWFCDGTWYTRISGVGDTFDIYSLNGASVTTLASTGSVVTGNGGSITLTGFTITSGTGTVGYGGGVLAASSTVTTTPNVTLDSCVVTGNSATYGGGVAAYQYGILHMVDTEISGNSATYGGGAWLYRGNITCTGDAGQDSGFWDNTATTAGGGVYIDHNSGTLLTTDCDFGTGGDDNSPDDVYAKTDGAQPAYGNDVDLICTGATGC